MEEKLSNWFKKTYTKQFMFQTERENNFLTCFWHVLIEKNCQEKFRNDEWKIAQTVSKIDQNDSKMDNLFQKLDKPFRKWVKSFQKRTKRFRKWTKPFRKSNKLFYWAVKKSCHPHSPNHLHAFYMHRCYWWLTTNQANHQIATFRKSFRRNINQRNCAKIVFIVPCHHHSPIWIAN